MGPKYKKKRGELQKRNKKSTRKAHLRKGGRAFLEQPLKQECQLVLDQAVSDLLRGGPQCCGCRDHLRSTCHVFLIALLARSLVRTLSICIGRRHTVTQGLQELRQTLAGAAHGQLLSAAAEEVFLSQLVLD